MQSTNSIDLTTAKLNLVTAILALFGSSDRCRLYSCPEDYRENSWYWR